MMYEIIKAALAVLPAEQKKKLLNIIKWGMSGFIFLLVLVFSLGLLSGYIYATELQQTRCLNTLIYSLQKVKTYDARYKAPTLGSVEGQLESGAGSDIVIPNDELGNVTLDVNPGQEVLSSLTNIKEFSKLENMVDRSILNHTMVLSLDFVIQNDSYDYNFKENTDL